MAGYLAIGCRLLILFYLRDHELLQGPRQFGTDAAAMVYRIAGAPRAAGGCRAVFRSHNTLRAENARLQQENLVLKGQTQKLAAVVGNGRWGLLNSANHRQGSDGSGNYCPDSGPLRHELVIDKGQKTGSGWGNPAQPT